MLKQWPGPINPTTIQAGISFKHFKWNMAIFGTDKSCSECPRGARPKLDDALQMTEKEKGRAAHWGIYTSYLGAF
jgi:hypothetical protein